MRSIQNLLLTAVLVGPLACSSHSDWRRETSLAPAPTSPAAVGQTVSIRVDDTRFGTLGEDCIVDRKHVEVTATEKGVVQIRVLMRDDDDGELAEARLEMAFGDTSRLF